jgi:hypothetical protein
VKTALIIVAVILAIAVYRAVFTQALSPEDRP